MAMIDRLAQAFAPVPDDPNDIENTKAVLLLAGGYKPDVGVTRRKELVDVLELEAELGEERRVESGQEIWIYSRRLIETEDPLIFNTVRENLQAGIKYKFFIHPEHAMDCVTLRQKLERQDPHVDDEAHQIIVLHRDAFMFVDNRMFMAILNARDDDKLRCFKTRKQSSNVFRYIELDPAEGIEYRDFLLAMVERVENSHPNSDNRRPGEDPPLPCRAEDYAQYVFQKLMIPDAANS
jgi:hypothetical protein